MIMRIQLVLSFIFIIHFNGLSQTEKRTNDYKSQNTLSQDWLSNISLGFSFNHSLLRGDAYGLSGIGVNRNSEIKEPDHIDWGFGFRLSYQVNKYVDFGLAYNRGDLTGVKRWETNIPYKVWSVDANYTNFNVESRLYLSKFIHRSKQPLVLVYGDVALGLTKSKGYVKNLTTEMEEKILSFNSDYFLCLGFGGGIEFRISKTLSIDLGTKLFYDYSDELDGLNEDVVYNTYNDAHWLSHLGINIDLSEAKPKKETRKWHRSQTFKLIDNEIVEERDSSLYLIDHIVIDTIYIENDSIECDSKCETLFSNSLFFKLNSHKIEKEDVTHLKKALEYLKQFPKSILLISGFTDKNGQKAFNLSLSEYRVNSVYQWFLDQGINSLRIKKNHYGEDELIYDADNKNRRVDIEIIPYKPSNNTD